VGGEGERGGEDIARHRAPRKWKNLGFLTRKKRQRAYSIERPEREKTKDKERGYRSLSRHKKTEIIKCREKRRGIHTLLGLQGKVLLFSESRKRKKEKSLSHGPKREKAISGGGEQKNK